MTLILGFDSGAFRAGWAFIHSRDGVHTYIESGISSLPRGDKEPFQKYRERLIAFWAANFAEMADHLEDLKVDYDEPDTKIVFEIVPAIGFQSGGATQSQLAQVMATTCQALCEEWQWSYEQVSATSVKKAMTGFGNATKVQIRDSVLSVFPELEPRRKDLTQVADESDAIAIALTAAGYRVPKQKGPNPRRQKKKQ